MRQTRDGLGKIHRASFRFLEDDKKKNRKEKIEKKNNVVSNDFNRETIAMRLLAAFLRDCSPMLRGTPVEFKFQPSHPSFLHFVYVRTVHHK